MSGSLTEIFGEDTVVSSYSDKQAIEDGVLVDLGTINRQWRNGIVNLVTSNLLNSKGYMNEDGVNIPNILDLLNQAARVLNAQVQTDIVKHGEPEHLYTGIMIEGPDGDHFEVLAGRNSTFYTLMLPEDH